MNLVSKEGTSSGCNEECIKCFSFFIAHLAVFPSDYQLEQNGTYCLGRKGKNTMNSWRLMIGLRNSILLVSLCLSLLCLFHSLNLPPSLPPSLSSFFPPLFWLEKIPKKVDHFSEMPKSPGGLLFSQKPPKDSTPIRSSRDVSPSVTPFVHGRTLGLNSWLQLNKDLHWKHAHGECRMCFLLRHFEESRGRKPIVFVHQSCHQMWRDHNGNPVQLKENRLIKSFFISLTQKADQKDGQNLEH